MTSFGHALPPNGHSGPYHINKKNYHILNYKKYCHIDARLIYVNKFGFKI